MPDARKSLAKLREEWRSCTRCELGARRLAVEGNFIFGEGKTRGVMFIGGGPGKDEEDVGHPFVGKTNKIIRRIADKLGLEDYYLTNLVACRACSPFIDAETGQPRLRKNWRTKQMEIAYKDDAPTPLQIEACLPRLYEEIYLVDPVVIVTLGSHAAKALFRKHISIVDNYVRGKAAHVSIPGAGFRSVRTEKRDAWLRSQGKKLHLPVEQSEVRYLCVPTSDPDFVSKKLSDTNKDGPFQEFARDIQYAVQIYERYMLEIFGAVPSGAADQTVQFDEEEITSE